MNQITKVRPTADDLDQYEEIAIAIAQSDMECVIAKSGLQRSDVAAIMGRPKSFVSKIMNGGHNLTVRTMARLFAACGQELRFGKIAVAQQWGVVTLTTEESQEIHAAQSEGPADAIGVACAGSSEEARLAA